MATRFSVVARLKSFTYAFAGFVFMLRTQHNAWLHLLATIVVITLGFALNVSADDWRWLMAAIALVWIAETVNTAFEHLCDVVQPEFHVRCSAPRTSPRALCWSASLAPRSSARSRLRRMFCAEGDGDEA